MIESISGQERVLIWKASSLNFGKWRVESFLTNRALMLNIRNLKYGETDPLFSIFSQDEYQATYHEQSGAEVLLFNLPFFQSLLLGHGSILPCLLHVAHLAETQRPLSLLAILYDFLSRQVAILKRERAKLICANFFCEFQFFFFPNIISS